MQQVPIFVFYFRFIVQAVGHRTFIFYLRYYRNYTLIFRQC